MQTVRLLNATYSWETADLFIAHCPFCRSDYYPDRITFQDANNNRQQKLECEAAYLRVSKHGIWVHRKVAKSQEHSLHRFHAGWSNFANWINDSLATKPHFTTRQSQRLFLEHFSRQLLVAHRLQSTFSSPAHSNSQALAESI
jgi:hypothetical protein